MNDIFRADAVRKLRDPQQLDTAIRLTSPSGWIALVAIGVIIATFVIWVFVGSLPFRANGLGILLVKDSEIFTLPAPVSGQIAAIEVQVGDDVKKGQVLVRIGVPETQAQLDAARANLASIKDQRERRETQVEVDIQARRAITADTITSQQRKADDLRQRLGYLQSRRNDERDELARGFITRDTFETTLEAIDSVQQQLRTVDLDIAEARSDQSEFEANLRRQLAELEQQVLEAENRVKVLETQLGVQHEVKAPEDGVVTEVSSDVGEIASVGTRLVTVSKLGEGMQMFAYLPVAKGKRVEPGMNVKVTPTTVERDIFGSINATVVTVSELPASRAELLNRLNNEQLVEQMLEAGAPIEVLVDLKPDPSTPSGLDWSSSEGPPVKITPGTTALATVTVREVAPIQLVVPIFETWVSGRS
ncbi:MAG: NHLP bacteriocin system secretion protein [Alphaproteobacteria bacterium]|nr:NHLP bacteriocin system secretion protein [Alphaproteobacteria bacterium]